tara:strand:- start:1064 stop:1609 length:546 start_codon:yes stop_codon:yes gene_type:complete
MEKKELRKKFLKIRSLITDRQAKEKKICNLLMNLNFKKNSIISGYFPIKYEVNIISYLESLNEQKINICFPSIIKKDSYLLFKRWDFRKPLIKGKFEIDEPDEKKIEIPSKIFVPILAYTSGKYRLGYGGGFYDRTIEFLEKKRKITTIGIAFEDQKSDEIPVMKFDKRLDMIITEKGILK